MRICVFGAGAVGATCQQVMMPLEFARAARVPALEALAPLLAHKARLKQLYS